MVIACLAAPAAANPGTAGWFELYFLVFGNLLIGLVEGGVAWALGGRWWALLLMVVANYVSAWIGWILVWQLGMYWGVFDAMGGEPLQSAVPAVWLTFVALSAIGLVCEVPFYLLAFGRSPKPRWKRTARGLLVANTVSAIGLAGFISANMPATLLSELDVVDTPMHVAADIQDEHPWVYFLATDEHSVMRIRPDGTDLQAVRRFENSLEDVRLAAFQQPDSAFSLGLTESDPDEPLVAEVLQGRALDEQENGWMFVKVDPDIGHAASVFERDREYGMVGDAVAPIGPAADLRPETERTFTVTSSWDGWRGMTLEGDGVPPVLALDGPFIRRNLTPLGVTVLPGDVLIFELAHEWNGFHAGIYIASLRSRTIARLTDGRNPVAVYPHSEDPSEAVKSGEQSGEQ